jgi:tRNA1Val (adenine37-N6)-methyltransferase
MISPFSVWVYLIISDMPNSWFQFKRFMIRQDRTAMKVGTDGVLLGAWGGSGCFPGAAGSCSILDIGTGTGLIALMLAQRFPLASVLGLEIDPDAAAQATDNLAASPWPDRIEIREADFRIWSPPAGDFFDMIVCNPPYFSRSLKNPDVQRSLARHDDELPLEALISRSAGLLSPSGLLAVVLPAGRVEEALKAAARSGLYLNRRLNVRGNQHAEVKRVLLEWGFVQRESEFGELVLESSRGVKSEEYGRLTGNFYL